MSLIYQERGGAWYEKSGWRPFLSVTWPFARLELHDDKIISENNFLVPVRIERPLTDIVSLRRTLYFPFFADGVRIEFSDGKKTIFWSFKNAKKIVRLITEARGSNPLP